MKVGLFFPSFRRWLDLEACSDLVASTEEAGLESLWVPDAIVFPGGSDQSSTQLRPMSKWLRSDTASSDWEERRAVDPPQSHAGDAFRDPYVMCAVLGSLSSRLVVGTSVALGPQRNPFVTARLAATIDNLTNGRFILGMGTGHTVGEFSALGMNFDERFNLLDETLRCLSAVWSGDPTTFHDARWNLDEGHMLLPPHSPLNLALGGNSKRVLRLAASHRAGWIPAWLEAEEVARGLAYLVDQRELIGIAPSNKPEVTLLRRFRILGRGERVSDDDGSGRPKRTTDQVRADFEALAAAGVDRVVAILPTVDLAVMREQVDRLGKAVV